MLKGSCPAVMPAFHSSCAEPAAHGAADVDSPIREQRLERGEERGGDICMRNTRKAGSEILPEG